MLLSKHKYAYLYRAIFGHSSTSALLMIDCRACRACMPYERIKLDQPGCLAVTDRKLGGNHFRLHYYFDIQCNKLSNTVNIVYFT